MKKTRKKTRKAPSAKQLAARRKFAAAAKARGKAAKKRNGKTIVKAKRVTIVQAGKKANPKRRRNITSALDLVHIGEAEAVRQGGQQGWKLTAKGKFYPGSATPKTVPLNKAKTKFLDLKYGDVWGYTRKGNPRKKNISQGFYDSNGVFHPIRAASDYDAGTAGETGGKAKRTRSKKRKASAAKASRTARDRAAKRAASKTKQHLASRALSRSYSLPAGSKRKKNIAQGFYDGNGIFHPIRASADYDGKTAGEAGGKPRRTRSKKRAASARKASQTARQKAATAQRKATTTRLAARSLQRSYPLKGKRNPNDAAKAGYESFQGKASTKSTALNFPNGTPANVYKLGSLHSITLADGRTIKPAGKAVWLCADTKGKLHLGTTGERLTNAPKGSLGKVKEVEYITSKPHLGDSKPARYFHQLGEETGEKPTLYSDGNGGLVFKGGAYSITSRGIVN